MALTHNLHVAVYRETDVESFRGFLNCCKIPNDSSLLHFIPKSSFSSRFVDFGVGVLCFGFSCVLAAVAADFDDFDDEVLSFGFCLSPAALLVSASVCERRSLNAFIHVFVCLIVRQKQLVRTKPLDNHRTATVDSNCFSRYLPSPFIRLQYQIMHKMLEVQMKNQSKSQNTQFFASGFKPPRSIRTERINRFSV